MNKRFFQALALVIALNLAACGSNNDATNNNPQQEQQSTSPRESIAVETNENVAQTPSEAGSELVEFPENYADGVLYTIVTRGNTYEELYTSREAIEAVQNGEPIPNGTVITLFCKSCKAGGSCSA